MSCDGFNAVGNFDDDPEGEVVIVRQGEVFVIEANPRASRTVPRLGIAAPHALRAVQRAQQRGLAVAVVGIPSCVLGPFAALRIPGPRAGTPAPPCAECPARDDCAALDPWYLDRFGPGELHPVPPVPRNPRAPWIVSGLEAAARAVDEGQ